MISITAIFFTAVILPILGFFHEQTMITKTPPGPLKRDAFFGYSLTSDEKSLIISAPAADQFGKLFEFNLEDNSPGKEIELRWNVTSDPNAEYDWLGATMKTYGPRSFVICAPRKIRRLVVADYQNRTIMSKVRCYILSLQSQVSGGVAWRDLANINQGDTSDFNIGIVSFGWSVDVDEHHDIWIASPVLSNNAIITYNEATMFNKTLFLPTQHLEEQGRDFVNFGYSMVSGNFLSETGVDHAVSYIYGDNSHGKVFIFEHRAKRLELSGDSVGSTYGAVLCKAHLGHKRASLLVGAPTFVTTRDSYDRGAVYLYVPEDSDKRFTLQRVIKGEKDAGYFGQAIASVGDMDGDQKDEVAIGAPFEDGGKGAVYIFSGDGLLSNRSWVQRIQGAGNSFAFSLLPLPDYSYGLSGLSVGAPFEDRVYVIAPLPVITVNVDTILPNSQVTRKNLSYVDFTIVVDVTYPASTKDIIAKFDVKLHIKHPNATLEHSLSDGSETYTLLFNSTIKSDKRTLKILTPTDGKYHVPILYAISVKFSDEKEDPNRNLLTLSERSNVLKRGELWVSDCKAQFHCVPDLSVDFQTDISDPYTVGSSKKSNFSLVIRNTGETAYSPCAVVSVRAVRVLRPAPGCALDSLRLVCKPTHPLPHNGEWNITDIELEMDALTSKTADVDSIDIMYDVYNDCQNKQDKISYNKTFGLRYDTGIHITGISIPSEPVEITSSDLRRVIHLQHWYKIMNNEVVNWSAVACDILVPKKKYLQYPSGVTIRRGSDTIQCSIEDEGSSKDILTAACNIGDLHKNGITEVLIDVEVLPNLLGKLLQQENLIVHSELKLKLFKDDATSQNVTTTLVLNKAAVPVWVIVLSVLFGLLILLLVGFILYKYNCLERKNKKKLEDLKAKNSIHRRDADTDQGGTYKTLEEDEDIVVVEATVAPDVAPCVEAVEHSVDNRIDHSVKTELIND